MKPILEFLALNPKSIAIAVVVIIMAVFTFKAITLLCDWIVQRFGLETKSSLRKKQDHELLISTNNELSLTKSDLTALVQEHEESVKQSIKHDEVIRNELSVFSSDIKNAIAVVQEKQDEIVLTVNSIVLSNEARDNAMMEEMCDRISQKARHYINDLHGIPEDEYDDFVRLFKAYQGIHGNHGAEAKYKYCIEHLPILPVETKLIQSKK